ncbi:hypothetical protein BZA05DRAFT_111495 [Tricharina praecox]|uniref:uncharacterized protein n=1 Tax=Tricharina praecox TaxID=43433 RepID=UPI002220390A|nr:uncharacterized protein BZA05DRAFT_111495 [Tricharina praecox]KAI5857976.1 hypothetical protein BZA05DRAFT_111495 [Tricharina praecox]
MWVALGSLSLVRPDSSLVWSGLVFSSLLFSVFSSLLTFLSHLCTISLLHPRQKRTRRCLRLWCSSLHVVGIDRLLAGAFRGLRPRWMDWMYGCMGRGTDTTTGGEGGGGVKRIEVDRCTAASVASGSLPFFRFTVPVAVAFGAHDRSGLTPDGSRKGSGVY